jgi:hypothetical protein
MTMSDDTSDATAGSGDDARSAMRPGGGEPFGAEKLPREQPRPDPADLTQREALRSGTSSRWLVPAGVLGIVFVVLFAIAYTMQPVVPTIGIVFVVAIWLGMLVVSRRTGEMRARNRVLAWLMAIMASGSAVLFFVLYAWEASL